MKIGSKIALFYTLISVLTTVIIIAVFYIFSTQYINKLYASYLREKGKMREIERIINKKFIMGEMPSGKQIC